MDSLSPLALIPVLAAGLNVDPWIFGFSFVTVAVTIWMGFRSAKTSKTASDFFVAGRSVSVGWNASAISGEYLSAASFMGVAGMVMSSGYDALWYPVCYACGYLFLLLFIAGPLRRFGAYTIPDFAEGRFDSPIFRKIAVCFVLFIGFFYTMPQMKGAGTTLAYIFPGMPYWGGVVLVGAVITLNVALGGMKGITLVQAFQYWAKMFAISVPIFVVMSVYGSYGAHVGVNDGRSVMATPAAAVAVVPSAGAATPSAVATVPDGDVVRKPLSSKAPADQAWVSPFGPLTTKAAKAAGLTDEQAKPYSLLYTYSLIIALVCGTAGLPHILVRFYTNPDGVAAKRTTMWVMILIGIFYVFPPIFGVIGRNLLPDLYNATGAKGTDKIVLELPRLLNERGGIWGSILSGITCAGAFAAFMSTFSGLLVSMTGAVAHGRLRPDAQTQRHAGTAYAHVQVRRHRHRGRLGAARSPGGGAADQLHGRTGLRHCRRQLLPTALHERLVAGHDDGRRGHGHARRWSRGPRLYHGHQSERLEEDRSGRLLGHAPPVAHPLRAARHLDGAAGDRVDDRRLQGHPRPGAR
jgi:cation/acetate symporter